MKINGKKVLNLKDGNEFLYNLVIKDKPFFISRLGAYESNIIYDYLSYKSKLTKKIPDISIKRAKFNAGMFSTDEKGIKLFINYTARALQNSDGYGYWNLPYIPVTLKLFLNKNSTLFHYYALDSFQFENPWTRALKGKKVLVISSFTNTIKEQYRNRKLIFKDENVLPDFTLLTYTPPITNGSNEIPYKTWEEALLKMRDDVLKIDFDIALLSCGSYGVPLGSMIKESGRSAIYVGGVLQMYFGIIGKRWENDKFKKFFNGYWVKSDENKPKDANQIDNGCYW